MEIPNVNRYNNVAESELPREEKKPDLMERMFVAKREARPLAEVEAEDEKSATLLNDFIYGRIGLQEFTNNDSVRFGILKPGEIELADLDEMRAFLSRLFQDEALANELTGHEKEHLDKINEIGWPSRLVFRFFKDEDGGLSGRPGVMPDVPHVGDEQDIRSKLRFIIEAANDLSDTDSLAIKKP